VLQARASVIRVPDLHLRAAVWGPDYPRHWRTDLGELLDGLAQLHVFDARDDEPALGTDTVLLTHAADLRGKDGDGCDADCPARSGTPHGHFLLNAGRGFLGVVEQFAVDEDDGIRRYEFRVSGCKGDTPLREVGKTGRLGTAFLPCLLGVPDVCRRFSDAQHR